MGSSVVPGGHRRRRSHHVQGTTTQERCSSSLLGGRVEEAPHEHTEEDALASVKCLFSTLYLYGACNVLISPYAWPHGVFAELAASHVACGTVPCHFCFLPTSDYRNWSA